MDYYIYISDFLFPIIDLFITLNKIMLYKHKTWHKRWKMSVSAEHVGIYWLIIKILKQQQYT